MNSLNNADGADISKLKAKMLELELGLIDIETGWLKRRKLRKELKVVQDEIDRIERKL